MPAGATTIDLAFAEAAARWPGRRAQILPDGEASYRELAERSEHWARRLRALGIGAEQRVALAVPQGGEVLPAILGILSAGAAYVPIDPRLPALRREAMLAEVAPAAMIRDGHDGVELIALADRAGEWRAPPPHPDRLAYILHSSGTTSAPKGAAGPHRGTLNRLRWMWRTLPFADDDVLIQRSSLAFGDSIWELFGGLLGGRPTLYPGRGALTDAEALRHAIARHRVTRLVATPGLLRALVVDAGAAAARALASLRVIVSSGEALDLGLAQQVRRLLPGARLFNLYGSIEMAADATWHEVGDADGERGAAPIGVPLDGAGTLVADAMLAEAGSGELLVTGAGIARGYWRCPAETAARFLPAPGGGRYFRSGDLAAHRDDGTLLLTGRRDRQVKLSGMRVELDEIEFALARVEGVEEVVVVAPPVAPERRHLAAFVRRRGGVTVETIRARLAEQLPDYMIPELRLRDEPLPRTATGKPDRRALEVELAAPPVAPSDGGDMAAVIAGLWAEVLGIAVPDIDADLFALGADSLSAMRVASRIRARWGIGIEAAALRAHRSAAAQAAHLSGPGQTRAPAWGPRARRIGSAGRLGELLAEAPQGEPG